MDQRACQPSGTDYGEEDREEPVNIALARLSRQRSLEAARCQGKTKRSVRKIARGI